MMNKKGNMVMNVLLPGAVTLFIVAIVFTLLSNVNTSFQGGMANQVATFANNQSLTWVANNTAIKLNADNVISVVIWNSSNVLNAGDGLSGNYTLNLVGGSVTFINGSDVVIGTDTLNATVTYYYGSAARNITGRGVTSLNTTVSYLPTIALVLVASLIVGIVLMMFSRMQ